MSQFIILIVVSVLCFSGCTNRVNPSATKKPSLTGKELFTAWGKEQKLAFDLENGKTMEQLLERIVEDMGNARVVVLSEGFHNCEEMLQLQYELITYLVQEKGFNTIATETGLPESKYINDYMHGGDSIPNMWKKSLALLYSEWKWGRATVEWLRQYNQRTPQSVDYIGVDIGGDYQDWEFPFEQIFEYLDSVDAPTGQQLRQDMDVYFEKMRPYAAYYYTTKFTREEQNQLVAVLDSLIQTFSINKGVYSQQSNLKDYSWVLQCIKSMRMAEYYYRNYQHVNDTTANKVNLYLGANGREMAMAQNIKWILDSKKEAKVIVINHVIHTKTASQHQGNFYKHFTPMGQLLQHQLGDDLFIMGMTYGQGQYWKNWQLPSRRKVDTIPPTAPNGLEQVMAAIAPQNYYLHFKKAPLQTYNWLYHNTTIRENDYNITLQPSEWDACFYLHEVSPAVAADTD
ncbi:MAG: erythromycin esterase family protein [Aureispira sp.]